MHLVLIETAGNQQYIFATNRLRENVGASQLTHEVGTRYVLEAIQELGGPSLWRTSPRDLHSALNGVPPVDSADGADFEPVTSTSGKALVLVNSDALAKELVSRVTRRALRDAPGLDVAGALVEFDWHTAPLGDAVRRVHRELEHVRTRRPGPEARFPAVPFAARCATSGLPASDFDARDGRELSRPSKAKRDAASTWLARAGAIVGGKGVSLVRDLAELEEGFAPDAVAVLHADGNGVGAILLDFESHVAVAADAPLSARNRAYATQLRAFSGALEAATEASFAEAIKAIATRPHRKVPVVPIVLGGDDLTLICDGHVALELARRYLLAFEQHTRESREICDITSNNGLTACAGIAIVKPHFPFFSAYELSEQLLQSAKLVKRHADPDGTSWSALDFHVLLDSSFTDLDDIRERLTLRDSVLGETRVFCRPYVVSRRAPRSAWIDDHHLDGLQSRVAAIHARDPEGRPRLPNGQLHDLREGLFAGPSVADARMRLMRPRYVAHGFDHLLEATQEPSLFRIGADGVATTRLLDALDASAIWRP